MFYIECTTYDEHNKSINNFLKENFKNEFKDMIFKINYENRKFILTYKNADLTSIDIENFLSVNTINELDKKKQIKTISLFIKIVDAYAKNFVNYNDNCISVLLKEDYDLVFSFKFEFWKGTFRYVYNQSALADGNSLTNENILADIVKDFVYIILKINNAIKAPVDGDIRVTMHSGRYQLFLYQESLVCGMFNFNDINELNIYLKENLLIKNLNIALEKIKSYKEQELKILEATLEQRHLSIKTKEVFLLYKKFGELCASEHLKGKFGINDSNFH
jgi:hypothetical protein